MALRKQAFHLQVEGSVQRKSAENPPPQNAQIASQNGTAHALEVTP